MWLGRVEMPRGGFVSLDNDFLREGFGLTCSKTYLRPASRFWPASADSFPRKSGYACAQKLLKSLCSCDTRACHCAHRPGEIDVRSAASDRNCCAARAILAVWTSTPLMRFMMIGKACDSFRHVGLCCAAVGKPEPKGGSSRCSSTVWK